MADSLGVEIEKTHMARALDLTREGESSLYLTTIKPDQRKAIINLYLISDGEKRKLTSLELDTHATKDRDHGPKIDLWTRFDGLRSLDVKIQLDGRTVIKKRVDIPLFWLDKNRRKAKNITLGAVGVLLAAAIAAGAILIPRSCSWNTEVRTTRAPERTRPAPQKIEDQKIERPESEYTATTPQDSTVESPDSKKTEEPGPFIEESMKIPDTATIPEPTIDDTVVADPEREPEPVWLSDSIRRTLYFAPNSTALEPEAERNLRDLRSFFNQGQPVAVRIEGHCALRGTEAGRRDIAEGRAKNTAEALGIESNGYVLEIRGWGADKPATTDEEREHLNRRVEVFMEIRYKDE